MILCGISTGFPVLFPTPRQVTHVLLTRPPLTLPPKGHRPFDLHVLSTPPAFILSQDQTLWIIFKNFIPTYCPHQAVSNLWVLSHLQAISSLQALNSKCWLLFQTFWFVMLRCSIYKVPALSFARFLSKSSLSILSRPDSFVKYFFRLFSTFPWLPHPFRFRTAYLF